MSSWIIRRFLAGVVTVSMAALLPGCTVGPHYHPPTPPTVGSYTPEAPQPTVSTAGPGGESQLFNASADIPAEWWTLFHSPALDRMVREALKNNPTLARATARLTAAQEDLNIRTGSAKYPTVTGNASAQREQVNLASFGVPFPNPKPFTLLNGSVAVSYALDLFGANQRLIEALKAQTAYETWQLQGARLMLTGNVVSTAIHQAEVSAQIDTTQMTLAAERKELDIREKRYEAGGISLAEVQSQRTAVAETQAQLPSLEQALDVVDHELATLMGNTPAEAKVERIRLEDLRLPEELPLSIPSELVRHRPDISASESLLHEASANVGVATANLYPQITLTGSAGGVGTRFNHGGASGILRPPWHNLFTTAELSGRKSAKPLQATTKPKMHTRRRSFRHFRKWPILSVQSIMTQQLSRPPWKLKNKRKRIMKSPRAVSAPAVSANLRFLMPSGSGSRPRRLETQLCPADSEIVQLYSRLWVEAGGTQDSGYLLVVHYILNIRFPRSGRAEVSPIAVLKSSSECTPPSACGSRLQLRFRQRSRAYAYPLRPVG